MKFLRLIFKTNKIVTLFQALRPIYVLSSIVGLAPYIQTDYRTYINHIIVIPKIIIVALSHGFMWYFMRSVVKVGIGASMLDKILNLQDNLWSFLVLVYVFLAFLNRNKIVDLFEMLQNFDKDFKIINNLQENYKNIKLYTFTRFVLILIVVSLCIYFDYIIYFKFNLILFSISLVSYHSFVGTTAISAFKFVIINNLIIERFKLINQYLDKSRIKCSYSQVSTL